MLVSLLVQNQETLSGIVGAPTYPRKGVAVAQGRREADPYRGIPPISSARALGVDQRIDPISHHRAHRERRARQVLLRTQRARR